MTADLERLVRRRAQGRCEYCLFPADRHPSPFQIDHIIARQHGGLSVAPNLALACIHCNRYKGPNIAGLDPIKGVIVRLFNPRLDDWSAHFEWNAAELIGRTPIGRATVQVLNMNQPLMVELRQALLNE